MGLRVLDRYMLRLLLPSFYVGISLFTVMLVGADMLFDLADLLIRKGVPLLVVLKLFFYRLPGVIALTFPMSMLLSVILGVGSMSARGEVLALMSCGISIKRVMRPVVVMALLVGALAFVLNETLVTFTNRAADALLRSELSERAYVLVQENVFLRQVEGGALKRVIYVSRVKRDGSLEGVLFQEFSSDRLERIVFARRALVEGGNWRLMDGQVYAMSDGGLPSAVLSFKEQVFSLGTDEGSMRGEPLKPEHMSVWQIARQVRILKGQGLSTSKLEMIYHIRLAMPWASVVLSLFAFPLALVPHRGSGKAMGFGLSVLIVFAYYVVMSVMKALGESALLPYVLCAWIPNLLFLVLGYRFYRRKLAYM